MKVKTAKRLLRVSVFVGMLLILIGVLSSIYFVLFNNQWWISSTLMVTGGFIAIAGMTIAGNHLPKAPPIIKRQLPEGVKLPPSYDRVSLPSSRELWRVMITYFAIWTIVFLAAIKFLFEYEWSWKEGFVFALAIAVYVHESFRGPHKRFWIITLLGEWRNKKWQTGLTGQVLYLIDTRQDEYQDPATRRLRRFFSDFHFFSRYYVEVKLGNGFVGYVPLNRKVREKIQTGFLKELTLKYRTSRLNPDRLELAVAE